MMAVEPSVTAVTFEEEDQEEEMVLNMYIITMMYVLLCRKSLRVMPWRTTRAEKNQIMEKLIFLQLGRYTWNIITNTMRARLHDQLQCISM